VSDPTSLAADEELRRRIGGTDIYLLDQILAGRFPPGSRILDVGCGGGRNIAWFLRSGYDVSAIDRDPHAVAALREAARELAPSLPDDRFRAESIESCSFDDASFDAVLAIAALHFVEDDPTFEAQLASVARVLRPGGTLFVRTATSIGIEDRIRPTPGRRSSRVFDLPDGSTRYLLDEAEILARTAALPGELLAPVKTTNVQGLRCMTTWVARKHPTTAGTAAGGGATEARAGTGTGTGADARTEP